MKGKSSRLAVLVLLVLLSVSLVGGILRLDFGLVKAAPIFSDGFESGNFSAWSGTYVPQPWDIVEVVSSPVHQGSYAAFLSDGGIYGFSTPYLWKNFSQVDTAYARFYVRFASSGWSNGEYALFCVFGEAAYIHYTTQVGVYNNNGTYVWRLQMEDDGAEPFSVISTQTVTWNTWYCVEVEKVSNASVGECRLYIDGTELLSITGKNTALTGKIDMLFMDGELIGYPSSPTNTYFDDFVVSDAYIGTAAPASPPSISILSPQNTTYYSANIPLTFTLNETASWIGYSLDGQQNVTVTGNRTLLVGEGTHSIIVYANNTVGNMGSSSIVYFDARIGISDVALSLIRTSKTVIGRNGSATINVTVQNKGDYSETSNLTLYANTTVLFSENITLASHTSSVVTFTWNTPGFIYGNYNVGAFIKPVPGESNITDNTLIGGKITVTILGDVNGDGKVNVLDLIQVGIHLGHTNGDGHEPFSAIWYQCINSDLNNDGRHNVLDLIIVALHLGQYW